MRWRSKKGLAILIGVPLIGLIVGLQMYWAARSRPQYQEEEVTRDRIVFHVNSTGTVQPVLSVHVGSFVSGPIDKLYVEFNQAVKKDQVLAEIDTRTYKSNVMQSTASLLTRRADVERVKAELQRAKNDETRAVSLRTQNKDFVSETEMDQLEFNRKSLEAQLKLAEAAVEQAKASLDYAEAQLGYCKIKSPVDGLVMDRKIDPGQTLAAQFTTPELFIVVPDLRKEMYVYATVDEADIGLIRQAQDKKQPVHFTVDSYPDDLFEGKIYQIRMNSTTTQNVVTYPVVVSVANPDLKLMPGMTANISFQIEEKADALRVPNAALRFYPKPEQVRPEDRGILEGLKPKTDKDKFSDQDKDTVEPTPSAQEIATANRKRNQRHVWVVDGKFLRAIPIVIGISDNKYTAVVSRDLAVGQKVVTGIRDKGSTAARAQVEVK